MKGRGLKNYKYYKCLYMALLFMFLSINSPAFDFQGRIDTVYTVKGSSSDRVLDQDAYQYHSLDMNFSDSASFEWFGGLRKDIDGKMTGSNGTKDQSDAAMRGLPDAANKDQSLEYRVYTGLFKYSTKGYGASLGRTQIWDYEFSQFDGGRIWLKPMDMFKFEIFAGKPYSYGYYDDYSNYWNESELIGGGGAMMSLLRNRLNLSVRYFKLREITEKNTAVDQPPNTFLSDDDFTKANASYSFSRLIRGSVSASMINTKGRSMDASLSGYSDEYLFNYRFSYFRQFIDIKDFGDRINQFSQFMTAYHPYQRLSGSFGKSLADIFSLTGPVSDIELEASYDYRFTNDSKDESRYNPKYRALRGGIIVATNSLCYLNFFYENIFSYSQRNDIQAYGGEVSKKWKTLTLRLGSAYYAHKYEATYSNTEIKDSFYAREYYIGVKYYPVKFLDVSFKASYEVAEITSLTDSSMYNQDVTYEKRSEIFTHPRDFMKLEFKLGYVF